MESVKYKFKYVLSIFNAEEGIWFVSLMHRNKEVDCLLEPEAAPKMRVGADAHKITIQDNNGRGLPSSLAADLQRFLKKFDRDDVCIFHYSKRTSHGVCTGGTWTMSVKLTWSIVTLGCSAALH